MTEQYATSTVRCSPGSFQQNIVDNSGRPCWQTSCSSVSSFNECASDHHLRCNITSLPGAVRDTPLTGEFSSAGRSNADRDINSVPGMGLRLGGMSGALRWASALGDFPAREDDCRPEDMLFQGRWAPGVTFPTGMGEERSWRRRRSGSRVPGPERCRRQ